VRNFFEVVIKFLREADMFLLAVCLISTVFGIILISSVTRYEYRNYVAVQIGAVVIGLILFVLFSYIDIDLIATQSKILFVISLLFIATLLIWGVGDAINRRAWLRLFGIISVQPGEIVIVPFIIIMARMIVSYKERKTLNSIVSILQILFVFGIMFGAVLYVSEDIGTALIYLGILAVMLYIGGIKLRWFALGAGVLAAVSPLVWIYFFEDRHRGRILTPFFPELVADAETWLWQPMRSVAAIAAGGFTGTGLGNGRISPTIPAVETDFIFAVVGEELGFVGGVLVVLLLIVIIARCIYVGTKSNNTLGMLVCTGVAAMFILQSIMNIGMALGFLPVIGIPLPFFSYGGSSIVTYFAAAGIVSGIKMRPKPGRFRRI